MVSVDLSDVYAGRVSDGDGRPMRLYGRYGNIRQAEAFKASGIDGMRSIAVDYSGNSGSPCLIALVLSRRVSRAAISASMSERTAVWPGDARFSRQWGASIDEGDSCNTSTMTFSAHMGTHVDSPRHTLAGGQGIDEMPLDEVEKLLIRKALERHGGSVALAAEALGLSRSALYRRIEKHGL